MRAELWKLGRVARWCAVVALLGGCDTDASPPSKPASDAPQSNDRDPKPSSSPVPTVGPFEVEGSKMLANPRDQVITPWLKKGVWEPVETALFRSEIHPGDVVVDVGANVGYFTLIAAQLVGDSGRVWAFEPDPDAFSILERNVELNGYKNVTLVNKALGSEPGTLRLFRHPTNLGDHRIYDPGDERVAVEVPVTTLDKALGDTARLDLIKVDTQGAECAVLLGASGALAHRDVALIMEYTPRYIRQMGQDPQACLGKLAGAGFAFYEIREGAPKKGVFETTLDSLRQRYPEDREDFTNLFLPSRKDLAARTAGQ